MAKIKVAFIATPTREGQDLQEKFKYLLNDTPSSAVLPVRFHLAFSVSSQPFHMANSAYQDILVLE